MTPAAPARWVVLALGLSIMPSRATAADRQIRPFIGVSFAGSMTYVDPDQGPLARHATIGVSGGDMGAPPSVRESGYFLSARATSEVDFFDGRDVDGGGATHGGIHPTSARHAQVCSPSLALQLPPCIAFGHLLSPTSSQVRPCSAI